MTENREAEELHALGNEPILNCPKCLATTKKKVTMEKRSNGRFVIDVCPSCGFVGLDAHEVQTIEAGGFIQYILNYFRKGSPA